MDKWIIATLALLATGPSTADDLKFDQEAANMAEILRSQVVDTRMCLNAASRVGLHQGKRDSDAIINFAVRVCGPALSSFLRAGYGTPPMSADAAAAYIWALAESELKRIPGVSYDSAPTAKSGRKRSTDDSNLLQMTPSEKAALRAAIADRGPPEPQFPSLQEKTNWLTEMSSRLSSHMPDREPRLEFLKTVYYEAKRAGLDPQMVLGLIEVASGFKQYSVSETGASGYMQVMPYWIKLIGSRDSNLFHMRTNLRFGCTILRHYLDIEKGDLYRALGRYNGSVGKPEYPRMVQAAWEKHWIWGPRAIGTQ